MDTITITVAENDPDVIVSATLNEDAVTITLNEAATGATGAGVPTGGSANDILKKTSATDYATAWETPTSAATASTIVRRDAFGGAEFGEIIASSIFTTATNGSIFTVGSDASIFTAGTTGAIYTQGASADIYTSNASASVKSYNFTAFAGSGAALRDSTGAAYLTWGATAGNISITVDTISTGHFLSNPSTATAGHFLTKNGTAPTIIAGRSAWFSSSTGDPQFRNGTSSAVTLVRSTDLGTNVATFLATPSSANLLAALTTSTGTGSAVFATSPTFVTGITVGGSNATGVIVATTSSAAASISVASLLAASSTGDVYFTIGKALTNTNSALIGYSTVGGGGNPYAFMTTYGRAASDLCVNTLGNVGCGTATPAYKLSVAGVASATGGFLYGTFTVATFPATTYLEAVVTDALAPAIGATVAAGGSAKCKVMYNGSAKIVTAVL